MVSSSSVDGLISGLDTTSLINQLMTAESSTQTALKARANSQQSQISAYSAVNTSLATMQTAAQKLLDVGGLNQMKATSSSGSVAATASAGALSQSLTFAVDRLARGEMHVSASSSSTSAAGFATGAVTIGGRSVGVGGGSMAEIVAAVNSASDLGVTAAAVQTAPGSYRLQLTSKSTGAASSFAVTGIPGADTPAVSGQDAQITIASGFTVASATNTFSGVMPGVTFSAKGIDPSVTVSVATDPDATANAVKGLVDAANSVLGQITAQTAYNAVTKKGSPLTGDSIVRSLQQSLMSATSASGGTGSLSSLGIQVTSTGSFTFDADAFKAKLAADPTAVSQALTSDTGFAAALKAQAVGYGDTHTGQIATQMTSNQNNIKQLGDQITDWDLRLTAKREAYQHQFSNLELALGKLKDQGSWLSGQLANL